MTGRDDTGPDVVGCSGITIGNDGIVCEYVPTKVVAGNTPMPVYPTQAEKDGA